MGPMTSTTADAPARARFPGISSRAYEHPTDRTALAAVRRAAGFESVVRRVLGSISDRRLRLLFLANAVRVTPRQLGHLHALLEDVCRTLDVSPVPELFVHQSPEVNASAIGLHEPFIVLDSSLLEIMSHDELRCVIAHEVAHIHSGHAFYKTVLVVFGQLSRWFLRGPTMVGALPVLLALKEWDRKSELSADRAGLLVAQDITVAQAAMTKLAGGIPGMQIEPAEFERQAAEYEETTGITDRLFKVLNLLWMSHPFPVLRVVELRRWAESGEYEKILAGQYPHRDDDDDAPLADDLREAGRSYASQLDSISETLSEFVSNAASTGRSALETAATTGRAAIEKLFPR